MSQDKWKAVDGPLTVVGTLGQVREILERDLDYKPSELDSAVKELEAKGHSVANFGHGGTWIFTAVAA